MVGADLVDVAVPDANTAAWRVFVLVRNAAELVDASMNMDSSAHRGIAVIECRRNIICKSPSEGCPVLIQHGAIIEPRYRRSVPNLEVANNVQVI